MSPHCSRPTRLYLSVLGMQHTDTWTRVYHTWVCQNFFQGQSRYCQHSVLFFPPTRAGNSLQGTWVLLEDSRRCPQRDKNQAYRTRIKHACNKDRDVPTVSTHALSCQLWSRATYKAFMLTLRPHPCTILYLILSVPSLYSLRYSRSLDQTITLS